MNTPRKVIWTVYLIAIPFFFYFGGSDWGMFFLIYGWILFLIAHFIWRDKNS